MRVNEQYWQRLAFNLLIFDDGKCGRVIVQPVIPWMESPLGHILVTRLKDDLSEGPASGVDWCPIQG